MSLKELVRYISRSCAKKPNRRSLHQMGKDYHWDADEVLALMRAQKAPSKKTLRELALELDLELDDLQRILDR